MSLQHRWLPRDGDLEIDCPSLKLPTFGFRILTIMPDTLPLGSLPSVFSPLAKALLDGFSEGVIVFDVEGRLLYANQQAREALERGLLGIEGLQSG